MMPRHSRSGGSFEVIPAIDIRGGGVVRLEEGDFARESTYGTDPAEAARRWVTAGARMLHVVDLDGARSGCPVQLASVAQAVKAARELGGACQVAGGLRDAAAVEAALGTGATRVVIGTSAVRDPQFARALVAGHGAGSVAVALDVRDGLAVGEGWRLGADGRDVLDVLRALVAAGVETFIVTSIARDGLLGGPDLRLLESVRGAAPVVDVIASGGIGSADDIRAVARIGCSGAIVGRALYDGTLSVEAALVAADRG
jgi:phosphoribosylformimino-5-aminoimidazole carboxamide ribotide isomerase